jgi:hypothetical protein
MQKKILILTANPKDTTRLRLDEEVREINNGLQRSRYRDVYMLEAVWAARPSDVRRAMLDHKPNIVHFCGHGSGQEGIVFEDNTGNATAVDADTLAGFFKLFADQVECVFLNACYSEVQAEAIAQNVRFVIGMRRGIDDRAAIEFAVAFYDALGSGGTIEFAYQLGCNAIKWTSMPAHLTPVLKSAAKPNDVIEPKSSILLEAGRKRHYAAKEAVANIEICYNELFKAGKPQNIIDSIYADFYSIVKTAANSHRGDVWFSTGECIIVVFSSPRDAVEGCNELLEQLVELNEGEDFKDMPLFVRVGIDSNTQTTSILDIPIDQRSKHSNTILDRAKLLQNKTPIGRITISLEIYEGLGARQDMFRPAPGASHLVLKSRPLSPQEEIIIDPLADFSSDQKQALPALCFPSWAHISPDKTLKDVRQILEGDLMVVLGDTNSKRGPLSAAATSDAVGMMEALAVLQAHDLRVGIDEWQDTADLATTRDIIIVGSGASNLYALVLNDIFKPLHFVGSHGHVWDQIVAGYDKDKEFFGRHHASIPSKDSGLMIISKSVFNPSKYIVWIAGITGMGTQAVASFFKDLLRGRIPINDSAIGCVVNPAVKTGVKAVVGDYYRKWRISDYEVIYQVDRDGKKL